MAEMAVANLKGTATGLACSGLVRNTHARVERAMGNRRSAMFEVKEFSVGNFNNGLADNVIIGPGNSHVQMLANNPEWEKKK